MDTTEEVVPPVQRPFGVSASAVVAIIGSLFVIAVGLVMATIPTTPPPGVAANPQISDATFHRFAIGMSVFLIALGALGIWTAIGLFSLRPWARTTIMVFAGIMTAMCVISIIAVAMIPFPVPKGKSAESMRFLRPFLIATYGIPGLIGTWWLLQFNRPTTKAAFAASGPVAEPERPLSVSIIAWMFLIAAPGSLIPILLRMPLFLFGILLTGLAAQVGYLGYALVSLYLGRGLLKRDELARKLAIVYFALTGAHILLTGIIPAWQTKMMSVQTGYATPEPGAASLDSTQLLVFSVIFAIAFCGGGTWFLVRNKSAFRSGSHSGLAR